MTIFTKTITFKICHEMYYYFQVCNLGRIYFRVLIPIFFFYFQQRVQPTFARTSPEPSQPSQPQERTQRFRKVVPGPSREPLGIIDITDDPPPRSPRREALERKVRNQIYYLKNVIVFHL